MKYIGESFKNMLKLENLKLDLWNNNLYNFDDNMYNLVKNFWMLKNLK